MSGDAFELLCGALGSILLRPAGVGSIAGEEGPALRKVVLHKSYCQPCYWLRISHGKMAKGVLAILCPLGRRDTESSSAGEGLIPPSHPASSTPGRASRPHLILFFPLLRSHYFLVDLSHVSERCIWSWCRLPAWERLPSSLWSVRLLATFTEMQTASMFVGILSCHCLLGKRDGGCIVSAG